ncbi:MAG: MFS transporter [archaeon]|nr:MFS transporter [archaeon]MCP8314053.1 MFS transporter [archaeon]MCP8316145.1 MFS transporter [archaeon]MCP8320856.1 MFS transporter [archaeon]
MVSSKQIRVKAAYMAILLLGIVSLMGDVVYEGSRGIIPDYFNFLGAPALIVGLIMGLGEFLGYAIRLVSGILADATKAYWLFIFVGYGLIAAVPLIAFSWSWELVALLILVERFGKALRSPPRDTVLSVVSKGIGSGKAFGIHEFLDQIGAILGPLIVVALMLYTKNDYSNVFKFMIIPYFVLLLVLSYTYKSTRYQTYAEKRIEEKQGLTRPFYIYTVAVTLNTIGLIHISLILFKASEILQPVHQQWIVPVLYLVVQGVDAPIALISGYVYDRAGVKVLIMPFIFSTLPPILALLSNQLLMLIFASVVFGLVLGMQESIYRAAVADLSPLSSRGKAYGLFNTAYGLGFLASGTIYGSFMDYRIPIIAVVGFALLTQIIAIFLLLNVKKSMIKVQEPYA